MALLQKETCILRYPSPPSLLDPLHLLSQHMQYVIILMECMISIYHHKKQIKMSYHLPLGTNCKPHGQNSGVCILLVDCQKSSIFYWKEPYILYLKAGIQAPFLGLSEEPGILLKRAQHSVEKSPIFRWKEPCILLKRAQYSAEKSPSLCWQEPGILLKRALYSVEKNPSFCWKEPYILLTRAQHSVEKSPIFRWKEPYIPLKRALYSVDKSPTCYWKELYILFLKEESSSWNTGLVWPNMVSFTRSKEPHIVHLKSDIQRLCRLFGVKKALHHVGNPSFFVQAKRALHNIGNPPVFVHPPFCACQKSTMLCWKPPL